MSTEESVEIDTKSITTLRVVEQQPFVKRLWREASGRTKRIDIIVGNETDSANQFLYLGSAEALSVLYLEDSNIVEAPLIQLEKKAEDVSTDKTHALVNLLEVPPSLEALRLAFHNESLFKGYLVRKGTYYWIAPGVFDDLIQPRTFGVWTPLEEALGTAWRLT